MAIMTILTRLIGNKYFHSRVSSWSTLNLGKVQRNHIIKNTSSNVFSINQTTPNHGMDSVIPNGDNVDILGYLNTNTTYYMMVDGFAGQHCNFDVQLCSLHSAVYRVERT